ncbi:DUF4190 domain-containing protein [Agromyces intestinalis]|uniref:DUF4190 domain-containing protein n=1 Tax=Agromyces intestinalis TaxID=2592652 RepID=A0A5C1YGA7_9MICO|nr:DUF4190 domain-containing protein [Agromyces intestinalis]QEO15194.1 DUF4190 domain-containing protein [Agromyces intestinalis]
MTDPNTPDQSGAQVPPVPPVPPAAPEPPAYGAPQPAAPAYQPPAAPAYGAPAAPAYGAPAYGAPPAAKTNVLAIVSLVSAFFISLVAIITGHIALNQIKKTGEQGRGLAIAGLVLGYIGLVVGLIVIVVWIILIAAAASSGYYTTY